MTGSKVSRIDFRREAVRTWASSDTRHRNWPVVYVIDTGARRGKGASFSDVYVGETRNAEARILQHLDSPAKQHLTSVRVVLDDTFNKSVCLDLESDLIRLLAGDGAYRVLNRNEGITDAEYYDRQSYRETFLAIFDELRAAGIFTRSIPEIENSELFKLSPFKALTTDQAVAVENILEGLSADLENDKGELLVVQGEPGTGKTIVAIYLMKLLADIQASQPDDEPDADSVFSEFFTEGYRDLLRNLRVGLVVPQQSLRKSIQRVFSRTPGLSRSQVVTPFEVGGSREHWDLLIVDEAHRLSQRANQPSGVLNKKFRENNLAIFGHDDLAITQLDWVKARSRHQIILLDPEQSVRPADLPPFLVRGLVDDARADSRHFPLVSQLRVKAGEDYVGWIRSILRPGPHDPSARQPQPRTFEEYDLRFFDDLGAMQDAIKVRDDEHGLARLVAGYAWEWKSRGKANVHDINLDGRQLSWNRTSTEWIASPTSVDEVGSIHTVQGYDLNYAGVIIGEDLRWNEREQRLVVDRARYFDKKGKENNPLLGKTYTDDELLRYICNIYSVLLTRGIRGTYVYVCDAALRDRLRSLLTPR